MAGSSFSHSFVGANAAVLAQQERNARLLLKRRDHAAHAGGRVLQRLRGGGQTSGLNGADERAVAIEFHGVLLCEIVKDSLMDHRFTQCIARVYAVVKSLEMGGTMARSYDLTSGSIPQHLLRLAAPLIMGNILQQLYNTVDAFILGRFAGDLEFAAVGVAGSVMNLFLFKITGACTGISVIFAQLYGAGERERFRREHWLALSCGLLVTLACSGLGFLLLSPLLRLIQTPSELKTFVSVYLTIILASLPAAFLYNLYGALLRAIGRANAALMVLAAAVTVNVALDYCFVARFQLGIAGAAWATAASQAISAVLCILYLRRKAPELIFARADCRMDGELLKQTAHFSFVTALHQSSLYIGKLLVQGAVNTGGTDMISAYTATTRIEGFANSFGDSGSAATSVLVAQNRGAGKEERVKESFRSSLFLMLAMGLAMSLIMYVSVSTSVGFMLGTRSGAAFENARDYLKLVALFYTLCFTGNTFAGYFNGIGKVCVPFLGATSHIALRVVLSWLLVGKMGLPAVALATGLGWVLVNALWTFVKWRMEKKEKAAERDIM